MLYMVIETFPPAKGGVEAVGRRFRERGRMIPEGSGVAYVASWMAADGSRCYQLMESPSLEAMNPWIAAWQDLGDFEVLPVKTSAEFWTGRAPADR